MSRRTEWTRIDGRTSRFTVTEDIAVSTLYNVGQLGLAQQCQQNVLDARSASQTDMESALAHQARGAPQYPYEPGAVFGGIFGSIFG
jgi:hypothetical protein